MEYPATRVRGWRLYATIQPVLFFSIFAMSITNTLLVDMIQYQQCKQMMNETDCNVMHLNSSSEEAKDLLKIIQPKSGLILTIQSCISTGFPAIISLYIGSYSDKYGRKPVLLVVLMGYFLGYVTLAALSLFDINPYWYLLGSVPSSLFGGFPAMFMTYICYITDITSTDNRAWHLAYFNSVYIAASLIGIFFAPIVFNNFGYSIVFFVAAVSILFGWIYSIIILKETVQNETGKKANLWSLFDNNLVKELFNAILTKKEGYNRFIVLCCFVCIALHDLVYDGVNTLLYMFSNVRLGWNITDFSIYQVTDQIVAIIGSLFLIKVGGSLIGLSNTIIAILACLSLSGKNIAIAFTMESWNLYVSSFIGIFASALMPTMRTITSESVPKNDLGKIFSLVMTMEIIVPFIFTPLYIFIYTTFLPPIYPCPVWFLPSLVSLIIVTFIYAIKRVQK